jgi:hypothetical protein
MATTRKPKTPTMPKSWKRGAGAPDDQPWIISKGKRSSGVVTSIEYTRVPGAPHAANDEPYNVVCEEHGKATAAKTKMAALHLARTPAEFCDGCKKAAKAAA